MVKGELTPDELLKEDDRLARHALEPHLPASLLAFGTLAASYGYRVLAVSPDATYLADLKIDPRLLTVEVLNGNVVRIDGVG